MSQVKDGFYYTKQHEWAKEEDGLLLVGISDYAQHALGDIVFVDIKAPGTTLQAGANLGTIESVKAAEDLYSPVGGVVAETNPAVSASPEKVNQDPYGTYLTKLKDYSKDDLGKLMDAKAYTDYLSTLEH